MRKTHQDIILTMQVFLFLGVALCLIADTSTKSVGNTRYNETAKHPQTSIREACNSETDCDNGAECKSGDDGKYCKCKIGTEGEKCEIVPSCKEIECGSAAECLYKDELQKGVCQCTDTQLLFDPDTKLCKKACNSDTDCDNGAECKSGEDGKYCKCKIGTEGEKCEIVPRCKEIYCGYAAECLYKATLQKGVCQCTETELSFDPDTKICKKPCNTKDDCKNGAECETNDDGLKYCQCKPGTEGGICEKIPECDKIVCGTDAECVYNIEQETVECQCNDKTLTYHPEIGKCRTPCVTDEDCKNGAECVTKDGVTYCKCNPGTVGDICQIVPECEDMDCGKEAKCGYSTRKKKAVCMCNDEKVFDPVTKSCKTPCEKDKDCKNGAQCVFKDGVTYCKCNPGTVGDICQYVPECDDMDCGNEAKCGYSTRKKKAACICDHGRVFDPDTKSCKTLCNKDEDCKNGAQCVMKDDVKYCECNPGTVGAICEIVPECHDMDCGYEAKCVYSTGKKKAVCMCNDEKVFDPVTKSCKTPCEKDKDCKNGAQCVFKDGVSYCKCNTGTVGAICEIVPECDDMDCGNEAKCGYSTGKKKAVCMCDHGRVFDPDTKSCKTPCELVEYQKKCYELQRECESDENEKEGYKCVCRNGQTEDSKGNCVDICEMERNIRKCEAVQRVCELDENESDGFKCVCKKGEVEDGRGKCAVCDCGENSFSCKYEDGKKVCDCFYGYIDSNGKCERCSCGRNSWSCNFEDGKKICDCLPGYGDKNGSCEDCDCGNDTFSCEFKDGKKSCVCDFGFKDNNGKCETCECGNNSFSCEFIDGQKVCNCHRFHGQKDGQCEICFCGIDIQSCRYNESGNKVCDCPEGYIEINGICEKISFPSTFTPTEITWNATRNSSVEHTSVFTTSYRNSSSSSTIRPTGADPCVAHLCQNGGTCVIVDNKSKCLCKKPYLGILCETDPCDWNPCMNNGVCKIENEKVKCYCKEPFAGKFCESPIKLDAYVVTLVAASVFSAIVLIFVTCVLCQRCRVVGTN